MPDPNKNKSARCQLDARDDHLRISLGGDWLLAAQLPGFADVVRQVESHGAATLVFEPDGLGEWDTALLTFLKRLIDDGRGGARPFDASGMPDGVRALLDLAYAVGERKGARREEKQDSFLTVVGKRSMESLDRMRDGVTFLGSATLAMIRFLTGRARYQGSELFLLIQEVGAQAFAIVSLISFLVGMILAFVGAVQLAQFGAGIYVANLVGLAMAREMGAMMTAIIMAGRTGAAFAAQGGMVVGVGMLDLGVFEYIEQTRRSVSLTQLNIGIIKGVVFGVLVAVAGCLRGMQCGNSSQAVGMAATSAVVTSIVLIIVTDGLFAVILNVLGI
jgi:phospholipid/cholesterol/gamma-HCH transport system permease protein